MRDEWDRGLELPLTWEQFHELPRNPAYKYEYVEHRAWLTPRPNFYRARLRLTPCASTTEVDAQWPVIIRPLCDDDWGHLAAPFAGAFHRVVPFSTMSNAVPQLLSLGYSELTSTFLSGNDSSMLWHWRNGFELLEYAGSYRRMFREIRQSRLEPDK